MSQRLKSILENRRTAFAYFSILLGFMLIACAARTPHRTSLEIQAFQTREFEALKPMAFNSTVSVFQDLGYIIETASLDTGIITAQSPSVQSGLFDQKQTYTRGTAFVEERRPGFSTVRLNFVETQKVVGKGGSDQPILDPAIYENAFNKIDDAIFIRTAD